jgi:hypothetical protein
MKNLKNINMEKLNKNGSRVPFELKSGNKSPYPFLGGLGKTIGAAAKSGMLGPVGALGSKIFGGGR